MTALRPISPGRTRLLGRYELLTEVAKSQLGPLWAARGGGEGRELALVRTVSTGSSIEEEDLDRLSEAAWWALELRHPKIALARDVVMAEGALGLVSEYAEGEVVRSLLRVASFKRMTVPAPVALRIVVDALEAIAFACEQSKELEGTTYVCGGLLPDSILVGANGQTRLLDLGVAGVLAGLKPGRHPEIAGYAAPERLDSSDALDVRADVFAAGVVLWELLAGRRLFVGSSFDAVAEKLRGAAAPRLDQRLGGASVSTTLADAVARALDRERQARPPTPADFAADLREASDRIATDDEVASFVDTLAGGALSTRRKLLDRQRTAASPRRSGDWAPPTAASAASESEPDRTETVPPPAPVREASETKPPETSLQDEPEPESLDSSLLEPDEPPEKPSARKPEPHAVADTEDRAHRLKTRVFGTPAPVDLPEAPTADSAEGRPSGPAADAAEPEAARPAAAEGASPQAGETASPADHPIDVPEPARAAQESVTTEAPASIRVQERTERARKWVAVVMGSMLLLLLAGLAISALRTPKHAAPAASSPTVPSAVAPIAPSTPPVAQQPPPTASATPPAAPSAEPSESAAVPSASASASASATTPPSPEPSEAPSPPPRSRPAPAVRHYHVRPRHSRPKHKFTPQGI